MHTYMHFFRLTVPLKSSKIRQNYRLFRVFNKFGETLSAHFSQTTLRKIEESREKA